jgi:hypothetical protein
MYMFTRTACRCIHFVHVLAADLSRDAQTTVPRILRNSLRIKPHKLRVDQNLTARGKQIR